LDSGSTPWDWKLARDVRSGLCSPTCPRIESLSYSAPCRQLCALGGDYYDFVRLAHNRLALATGDASGKGLAAALNEGTLTSPFVRPLQCLGKASYSSSLGGSRLGKPRYASRRTQGE
jgi:hypothetical protein